MGSTMACVIQMATCTAGRKGEGNVPYIWRPGEVWRRYLKASDVAYDEASFQLGAMYVTLEMLSHMKMLEERAVVSEWGRQGAVSTLHTLLLQLNLADETYA